MNSPTWLSSLEQTQPSFLLLSVLTIIVTAAVILERIGLIGWTARVVGLIVTSGIVGGFRLWKRLLGWATWVEFLAIAVLLLIVTAFAGNLAPILRVAGGLGTLFMGVIACFAYMFIDLERNEVSVVTWRSISA